MKWRNLDVATENNIKDIERKAKESANLIWNAANSLFGAYKPHEYGLVILPMCVIKRFHDCLLPKHDQVIAASKKYANMGARKASFLKRESGYQFYNTSEYTFKKLIDDPNGIEDNFEDFIGGFSDNVQEILSKMNFFAQVDRMKEAKILYQIVCDFGTEELDMSERKYSTVDMGYIFENLVQTFSESYGEEAGAHFTSRDIIYLMCDLLTSQSEILKDKTGLHCTVYDMTMGTSQMLTCMEERLKEQYKNYLGEKYNDSLVDIQTFGQEFNPETMGIAVADTLIHGGDPDNMKFGNTLSDDQFKGYNFDFIISNPPFGIDWKREAKDVEKEHKLGEEGRFAPGLPNKGDGQMLFLLNGIKKLKDNGRMAIIQNASSLFTGDAGSGPSEIRKYILTNDLVDAIIQLPGDSFYNTPISTYVWIIDKSKPSNMKGKIQLIDASECYETRRKLLGDKKVDITDVCREMIVRAYTEKKEKEYSHTLDNGKAILCSSKLLDVDYFGYYKVTVESPLLDSNGEKVLKKGKVIADKDKRDFESIPFDEDIDEYMKREVYPYNSEAWIDKSKTKIGYEISFSKLFYKQPEIESADDILKRIQEKEKLLMEQTSRILSN